MVLETIAKEGERTAPEIREKIKLTREHTARLRNKLYKDGYLERDTNKMPYVYRLKEEWNPAAANYRKAWRLSPCMELAVEIAQFHQQRHDLEATRKFIAALPHRYRCHERIQLVAAALALEDGDGQRVREILLAQDYRTIREGETVLTDLWFASHVTDAQKRLGRERAVDEAQRIRRQNPPPARLDFRLD